MCDYAVGVYAIECSNNTWNNREMRLQMDCAHQHRRASAWRELPVPALPCQHRRQPCSISSRPPSGGPLLVSSVGQTLVLVFASRSKLMGHFATLQHSGGRTGEMSSSCLFVYKGVCAMSPWRRSFLLAVSMPRSVCCFEPMALSQDGCSRPSAVAGALLL